MAARPPRRSSTAPRSCCGWQRQPLHCGRLELPHPQGGCHDREHFDRRRHGDARIRRRWRRGHRGGALRPQGSCVGRLRQPLHCGHSQPPHPQGGCHDRKHLNHRRITGDGLLRWRWRRGHRGEAPHSPKDCVGWQRQPLHCGRMERPHPQGRCRDREHFDRRRVGDGRRWRRWRRSHRGKARLPQRDCVGQRRQPLHCGHSQPPHPPHPHGASSARRTAAQ